MSGEWGADVSYPLPPTGYYPYLRGREERMRSEYSEYSEYSDCSEYFDYSENFD